MLFPQTQTQQQATHEEERTTDTIVSSSDRLDDGVIPRSSLFVNEMMIYLERLYL